MPSPFTALLLIRSIGINRLWSILKYSWRKRTLDQRYEDTEISEPQSPGGLLSINQLPQGAAIHFEYAHVEIVFLESDLVRITWQPGELPIDYSHSHFQWKPAVIEQKETANGYAITSQSLQISISNDGTMEYSIPPSGLIRVDSPPCYQTVAANAYHQGNFRWRAQGKHNQNEAIIGLGEHSGSIRLMNRRFTLWNTDPGGHYGPKNDPLYMPLPIYLVLQPETSHLIFYENSHKSIFSFQADHGYAKSISEFQGGALRFYFILGDPPRLMDRLSQLTGRPVLPPLWSLGYHQSRWGYDSASQVRDLAAGFQLHEMPLSAIHLDIDYMHGFRVFTIDPSRFMGFSDLTGELHEKDIQLVAIVDPGVKVDPDYSVYAEGLTNNHFVKLSGDEVQEGIVWPGEVAYPDFTRPETRIWWGKQYQELTQRGVDGIWHDMNEPAAFAIGDNTLPLAAAHNLDGAGGDHLQAHNLYGYQMNRAAFEGLQALRPQSRPWIVSRSGWVANSRYAWNWTADVASSWEGLQQTVATLISMSCSGVAFTGSDIGGFSGNPSPELYLRWMQMACFNAFMRTHSAIGTARREPWVFGEPFTSIIRQTLKLRYRLLPYLYTTAWQAAQFGWPMLRPVFWNESTNDALWQIEDAFLFGDAFLIAPILDEGLQLRKITLPSGNWIDFWDEKVYTGPSIIDIPVSLEHIPILIKDHSLIPMQIENNLNLHLYSTGQNIPHTPVICGQLYTDAGDGYGDQRLDQFYLHKESNYIVMTWSSDGEFPFPYKSVSVILHGLHLIDEPADKQQETNNVKNFSKPFKTLKLQIGTNIT